MYPALLASHRDDNARQMQAYPPFFVKSITTFDIPFQSSA
jgi:hypothetical protein